MDCRTSTTPSVLPQGWAGLLAIVLAVSTAFVSLPSAAQDSEASAAAAEEASAEAVLVDEQSGLQYTIEKLDKVEGSYRWVDENTIRFRGGIHFEVVDHDEETLWVKSYSAPMKERTIPNELTEEEKAAEIERVVASYKSDLETVDRLQFDGFENGLPRRGQWRQGMDIADMNGDGHPDIVFGPARKSSQPRPNIFLGDSAGNWQLWKARYPRMPYDYGDAAAGDFNGDGHMDLAFGVHLRGLMALVSDGQGGFKPWSDGIHIDMPGQGGTASGFSSRAIELIDWNQDGRLDILALGEGPKGRRSGGKGEILGEILNTARGVLVFANQGDGTWVPEVPTDRSMMVVQFGDNFALADFNQDGRTDIVLASRMRNNRNILGIADEQGLWSTHTLEQMRTRTFVGAVAAADHDGDGVTELIIGYQTHDKDKIWRTGLDVFKPDADLNWQRRTIFTSEGRRGITSVQTGDLDGDGGLDVVATSGNGEVWVFLGDGEGFFVREDSPELPAAQEGCRGYAMRLSNLDGAAGDELIIGFAGEATGLPGIPGYNQPGCQGEGSLRAWKAVRNESGAQPASASATAEAEVAGTPAAL